MTGPEWTRRDLVATSLVLGGGLATGGAGPEAPGAAEGPAPEPRRSLDIVLTISARRHCGEQSNLETWYASTEATWLRNFETYHDARLKPG